MCDDPCKDCMEDGLEWLCLPMDESVLNTYPNQIQCEADLQSGVCDGTCFRCHSAKEKWGCLIHTDTYQ